MSLFPHCAFALELQDTVLVAGAAHDVCLVLTTNRELRRAERVRVEVWSVAQAGIGQGKGRVIVNEALWHDLFEIPLPAEGLAAGTHRFPLQLQIPADLGPVFTGEDCSRTHELQARLEVDWAVDPSAKFPLPIVSAPRTGQATPLVHRSPPDFARDFLVDLSLESNVLVRGQPLRGEVALRCATDKKCRRLVLRLGSRATVRIKGQEEIRRLPRQEVVIPMVDLEEERRVRFEIPTTEIDCTHLDGVLDSEVELSYALDLSWSSPTAGFAITVLPPGSELTGSPQIAPLLAKRSVVEGEHVRIQVADAPRNGAPGALVTMVFPDLALGTKLRELGLLDGFAQSPLLPEALANRHRLRSEAGTLDAIHRARLYDALLGDLESCNQLELDDESLRYHLTLADDSQFEKVHHEAVARGQRLTKAIAAFPFSPRLVAHEESWRMAAAASHALLLPHRPAIYGLSVSIRTSLGEPRVFPFTITADTGEIELRFHLEELDGMFAAREQLDRSPLLESVRDRAQLTWATPWQISMRAKQPSFDVHQAVLAAEILATWVMHARGEAQVTSPYR